VLPVLRPPCAVAGTDKEGGAAAGGKRCEEASAAAAAAAAATVAEMSPLEAMRDKYVSIVTTASLPWMTGTAVNPLLRAAYLSQALDKTISLVIPWVSKADQSRLFPNGATFETPDEQEVFIRKWLSSRIDFEPNIKITFYAGKYSELFGSIMAVGDLTSYIPDEEADFAVLEEPEHLNWYHHGRRFSDKFNHTVGVVHTNYLDYVRRGEQGGEVRKEFLRHVNEWVVRAAGIDKIIKLSDAVQSFPRSETCFVHGVSPVFLEVGRKIAQLASDTASAPVGMIHPSSGFVPAAASSSSSSSSARAKESEPSFEFAKQCYFIGKAVWGKGYSELIDLMAEQGASVPVDVFGHGADFDAIKSESERRQLQLKFHGARDHSDQSIHDYKVFINPSTSDVVATTSAEALAMGKFVICAKHPSNEFFAQFPNCLIYTTPEEFKQCLNHALSSTPNPLREEDLRKLSWEDATQRLLRVASSPSDNVPPPRKLVDKAVEAAMYNSYNALIGFEPVRRAFGAEAFSKETLPNVLDVSKYDLPPEARRQDDSKHRKRREPRPIDSILSAFQSASLGDPVRAPSSPESPTTLMSESLESLSVPPPPMPRQNSYNAAPKPPVLLHSMHMMFARRAPFAPLGQSAGAYGSSNKGILNMSPVPRLPVLELPTSCAAEYRGDF